MNAIQLSNLTKYYGKSRGILNLNLDVKEGEFLSVLGPSGCGKTTLLRILIGLEKRDDGEILLDAQDIPHFPRHSYSGITHSFEK